MPGITQDLFHFVMVNDILIGSVEKGTSAAQKEKGRSVKIFHTDKNNGTVQYFNRRR